MTTVPKHQLFRTILFDHGREAIKDAEHEVHHSFTERQRVQSSIEMSDNKSYHKDVMCGVCGKVMRDNNLKRHMELKHRDCELNVERRWPMTRDCSNELNKRSKGCFFCTSDEKWYPF